MRWAAAETTPDFDAAANQLGTFVTSTTVVEVVNTLEVSGD